MRKSKKINLFMILVIIVILVSFLLTLPGCIGQKPPRYEISKTSSGNGVTEETIYGNQNNSQNIATITRNKIMTISSEGVTKVIPDIVKVKIEISTEKPSSKEAVDLNSTTTQDVITAIKNIGQSDLKIETIGYNLQPLYNYIENKPPQIYAYNATTTLLITTSKMEKIGDVISTAVEAGASNISSITYDLSDNLKKNAKNEALVNAIKDANDKSDVIAKAMAVKIIGISTINELSVTYPNPIMYQTSRNAQMAASMAAAPVIIPEELEVRAQISVDFIFQ